MRLALLALVVAGSAALVVPPARAAAPAGDGKETPPAANPLAGLPSAPGPHLDKIKALGDNQWLNLGSPAADPKWGKGRGRSWGAKMAYAPDLGGAFLFGQGVHGFVKPDGHYMDDLFFYDLNGHRWIAAYPGTDTRTFVERIKAGELKVDADGQLVDQAGRPVPFAGVDSHSYEGHTYASDLKKYVYVCDRGGLGGDQYTVGIKAFAEGEKLLAEQAKGKADKVQGAPFMFNAVTGQYERAPLDGYRPRTEKGSVLCYLPGKRMLFHFDRGETSLYDFAAGKWAKANPKGKAPPGIDFGACYDSKRERVYLGGGTYREPWRADEGKIYIYDVKTNAWSNPPPKGAAPDTLATNVACLHYDAATDRVIDVVHAGGKRGVFVFDPESAAWGEAPLAAPAGIPETCWSGFYSPERNAHFFHVAGDSQDNGTMWVYRYKRPGR